MLPSSDLADTPEQDLWPRYDGRSLLNLVTTLAGHFSVTTSSAPFSAPLPLDDVRTVVLFVVDGLVHFQLNQLLSSGHMPRLAERLTRGRAGYTTATSTFPSSTMTAMTTIHTGVPPAWHGWLGTAVHHEASVVDVLVQRDVLTGLPVSPPDQLLSVGSLYRRLANAGVEARVVSLAAFEGSFLNAWYFDGATSVPYEDLPDLPAAAARAASGGGPRYVLTYLPGYDNTCHAFGPSSTEAAREADRVDAAFDAFLRLVEGDGSTLVVLTGDHGHSDAPADRVLALHEDERLQVALRGAPAGENHARYFRVRSGMGGVVEAALAGCTTLLPARDAWHGGLFGGAPAREAFVERVGDMIAVGRPGGQLTWAYPAQDARARLGMHGGWSAALMVVPVVTVRG